MYCIVDRKSLGIRSLFVFVQMSDIFRISSKVVVTSGFRQKKLADTKRITIEEKEHSRRKRQEYIVVAKEETAFILHNVRNALLALPPARRTSACMHAFASLYSQALIHSVFLRSGHLSSENAFPSSLLLLLL